jgi:hypothetical protein
MGWHFLVGGARNHHHMMPRPFLILFNGREGQARKIRQPLVFRKILQLL